MNSKRFFDWCRESVSGVRYRPDRDAVHQELYSHLEDRYEAYLAKGMDPQEAEEQTLLAMGSASEIALQLAVVHRPFWGYLLLVSRCVLTLLTVLTLIFMVGFLSDNDLWESSFAAVYPFHNYDAYTDTSYQDENQSSVRIMYLEPDCHIRTDGYTISVTRAAYWKTTYTPHKEQEVFYMRLEVTNPTTWAEQPQAITMFWAEDSLGNRYYNRYEHTNSSQAYLGGDCRRTGLFTYTFELYLDSFISQEAQWIDLRYNRDGRDIALRIDLTGGVAQ